MIWGGFGGCGGCKRSNCGWSERAATWGCSYGVGLGQGIDIDSHITGKSSKVCGIDSATSRRMTGVGG